MMRAAHDIGPAYRTQWQPRGYGLLAVSLALAAAGFWRVDGVMAALGLCGLGLLLLAWWLGRCNLRGLHWEWDGPEKVTAAEEFPFRLSLRNERRWLDGLGLECELRLAGQVRLRARAAWVPAGSAVDWDLRASVPERGETHGQDCHARSGFPLGLMNHSCRATLDWRLRVKPRPVEPPRLPILGGNHREGHAAGSRPVATASGDPLGPRPWRPGDSPKRILWPASLRGLAAGTGCIVPEMQPPGESPERCLVLFHSFGTDGSLIRPDRFERAIALVWSVLRQLRTQGTALRFAADFDEWKCHPATRRSHLALCVDLLTRARRATGTEAHDLQRALSLREPSEGLVIVSDMPVESWKTALPAGEREQAVLLEPEETAKRGRRLLRR